MNQSNFIFLASQSKIKFPHWIWSLCILPYNVGCPPPNEISRQQCFPIWRCPYIFFCCCYFHLRWNNYCWQEVSVYWAHSTPLWRTCPNLIVVDFSSDIWIVAAFFMGLPCSKDGMEVLTPTLSPFSLPNKSSGTLLICYVHDS